MPGSEEKYFYPVKIILIIVLANSASSKTPKLF
jgi:hypothetical protein